MQVPWMYLTCSSKRGKPREIGAVRLSGESESSDSTSFFLLSSLSSLDVIFACSSGGGDDGSERGAAAAAAAAEEDGLRWKDFSRALMKVGGAAAALRTKKSVFPASPSPKVLSHSPQRKM